MLLFPLGSKERKTFEVLTFFFGSFLNSNE